MTLQGSKEMCASAFDTKHSIYEDLCGPYREGTALYCNDDACGPNGWSSSLQNVTLVAGQTYFIAVDGYGPTDKGPFERCFDFSCYSDLSHDGLIGTADLMLLLVGFGTQYNLELDFPTKTGGSDKPKRPFGKLGKIA